MKVLATNTIARLDCKNKKRALLCGNKLEGIETFQKVDSPSHDGFSVSDEEHQTCVLQSEPLKGINTKMEDTDTEYCPIEASSDNLYLLFWPFMSPISVFFVTLCQNLWMVQFLREKKCNRFLATDNFCTCRLGHWSKLEREYCQNLLIVSSVRGSGEGWLS